MSIASEILTLINSTSGPKVYQLPHGSTDVTEQIVIPQNTKNLTIRGYSDTVLVNKVPEGKPCISTKVITDLANNWWLTGAQEIPIENVPDKSSILQIKPGKVVKPGWYVLWDDYRVVCSSPPNTNLNHAELVYVSTVSDDGSIAILSEPCGREFIQNSRISPMDACENIRIDTIKFIGRGVQMGCVYNLVYANLDASQFTSDAIMVNTCKKIMITKCSAHDITSTGGAGSGYGISVYRSRNFILDYCTAYNTRHGLMAHSGSLDGTFQHCTSQNGYDTHGYDERRIALYDCKGDGGDIGNDAWLAGAKDVLIKNCSLTGEFGFHPNVKGVRVVDSYIQHPRFFSTDPGETQIVGTPDSGIPENIRFDRCSFGMSPYFLGERFKNIQFYSCSWNVWGTILNLHPTYKLDADLHFYKNSFINDTQNMIQLCGDAPTFLAEFIECSMQNNGSTCVWVRSDFAGSLLLQSCTYKGKAGAKFLANDSTNPNVKVVL